MESADSHRNLREIAPGQPNATPAPSPPRQRGRGPVPGAPTLHHNLACGEQVRLVGTILICRPHLPRSAGSRETAGARWDLSDSGATGDGSSDGGVSRTRQRIMITCSLPARLGGRSPPLGREWPDPAPLPCATTAMTLAVLMICRLTSLTIRPASVSHRRACPQHRRQKLEPCRSPSASRKAGQSWSTATQQKRRPSCVWTWDFLPVE